MTASGVTASVVVVGAGIAGIACAREIAAAGLPVVVRDRGRVPGGRLASRTVAGRRVDTGASYFTVREPGFRAVAEDWLARGVAREWTDTFHRATPLGGLDGRTTGPMRYAGVHGQRGLVEDLASGLAVRQGAEVAEVGPGPTVDGVRASAVVLAMPDPQALDLLHPDLAEEVAALDGREWQPSLALYAGWAERCWPDFDGAFVADSGVLAWVADDGRRRGDGAPVLVAHSTPEFAWPHLDDPAAGGPSLLSALRDLLEISTEPAWVGVQRWSLSAPVLPREPAYHLGPALVGLCGDGWGRPRVETAFLSGQALGRELANRLAPARS